MFAGMSTIRGVWQPPVTSLSLFLPPSCQSCHLSIRHTSSSPTVSGNCSSTCLWVNVSVTVWRLCVFQNRDVEQSVARSRLSAGQSLLENHHLWRQRGGSPGTRRGWYAAGVTWQPAQLSVADIEFVLMHLQESFRSWDPGRSTSTPAAPPSPPPQSTWRVTTPSTG